VYYDLQPFLSYRITERNSVELFYRYSHEDDRRSAIGDGNSIRNIIELRFKAAFPISKTF
jgi:hypothetical protein